MSLAGDFSKHSVTMPTEISAGVRERVGARGFSAYVSQAVARQLERDALDELLADMDATHGPVDEEAVAGIMSTLAR